MLLEISTDRVIDIETVFGRLVGRVSVETDCEFRFQTKGPFKRPDFVRQSSSPVFSFMTKRLSKDYASFQTRVGGNSGLVIRAIRLQGPSIAQQKLRS